MVGFENSQGSRELRCERYQGVKPRHPSESHDVEPDTFALNVEAFGLQSQFLRHTASGTEAYIAFDSHAVIVAFRGTEKNASDFLTDARIKLVPWPHWQESAPTPQVHTGFCHGVDAIWPELNQRLLDIRQDNKQSIWFTGHSLGGALAMLSAARLAAEGLVDPTSHETHAVTVNGVYTYGQPRVGDQRFADGYQARLGDRTFRYVNNRDIVARVPPRALGFRHAGELRYFDGFGRLHDDPGWWLRFLDTVPVSVDQLKDRGAESVADHSMNGYVELLSRQLPANARTMIA